MKEWIPLLQSLVWPFWLLAVTIWFRKPILRILDAIMGVKGVRNVHALRTRRIGPHLFVDVHIQVDPDLTVADGHEIAHQGQDSVLSEVEEVSEVNVHVEPDEAAAR